MYTIMNKNFFKKYKNTERCYKCGQEKPLGHFMISTHGVQFTGRGCDYWCASCKGQHQELLRRGGAYDRSVTVPKYYAKNLKKFIRTKAF